MSYKILSDFVRVRKCFVDHLRNDDGSVLIFRPDDARQDGCDGAPWLGAADMTNWAEIVDIGPQCVLHTSKEIGDRVLCPERHEDMHRLVEDDFVIREGALPNWTITEN